MDGGDPVTPDIQFSTECNVVVLGEPYRDVVVVVLVVVGAKLEASRRKIATNTVDKIFVAPKTDFEANMVK